jgi:circadian clock protein KaiC
VRSEHKNKVLKDKVLKTKKLNRIQKSKTGIQGLDEITNGGFPKGRPTLVCGKAGCGKTLLAVEFIIRGATQFNEPGVIVTFEESVQELTENVASLGFDLNDLIRKKKLMVVHIEVDPNQFEENGRYDLEGLFIRIDSAIEAIGAKRIALDTIETLFAGLPNPAILRRELQRLFRWFKAKGITVIITGESGDGTLTRNGIEEYVSDCVLLLDHRVKGQVSTRRLRIVKYRGTKHGTNEYPFLINDHGLSVIPITSLGLLHSVGRQRISSGIPELDQMLSGKGYYRGSTVLTTGVTGTGKSSFAAHFANACCLRGERVLYFAFEESKQQIIRNMRSIGIDLEKYEKRGLLAFRADRPTIYGLERHLAMMSQAIEEFKPQAVIIDPINSFVNENNVLEAEELLIRLVDLMKISGSTFFMTNLSHTNLTEYKDMTLSSLVDTWIQLRHLEVEDTHIRQLFIIKSRGMAHSNQIREYTITKNGIKISDQKK